MLNPARNRANELMAGELILEERRDSREVSRILLRMVFGQATEVGELDAQIRA
jgi:hypothetical protein